MNKQLSFFPKSKQTAVILSKCKQTAVIFQKCKQTADIYGCVFTFRRIFLTVLTYDISVPILKDTDIYRPIPISEKLADIGRYRYRYRSNTIKLAWWLRFLDRKCKREMRLRYLWRKHCDCTEPFGKC